MIDRQKKKQQWPGVVQPPLDQQRGWGGVQEGPQIAQKPMNDFNNQKSSKNERLLQAALEPWGWGGRKCISAAGDVFKNPKKHDEFVKRKMCIYK